MASADGKAARALPLKGLTKPLDQRWHTIVPSTTSDVGLDPVA